MTMEHMSVHAVFVLGFTCSLMLDFFFSLGKGFFSGCVRPFYPAVHLDIQA